MANKKLIEVALPLEAINNASAKEKAIRFGHPSTLHLWWARRPLAAARAVIWSSLVDDPSSHPEKFPTEEEQSAERQRLFRILEKLVVWENSNDEKLLSEAKREIFKCVDTLPAFLDPFSGGGAIPFEAQRLGLEAYAHDLNPVAVAINKAMIEIPPRFYGNSPVNTDNNNILKNIDGWTKLSALASDIKCYGEWVQSEAKKRIGYLYPEIELPKEFGGRKSTVISWLWVRTVKCPNPACGAEMPLASSFVLSSKKGKEVWSEPIYEDKKLKFIVHYGKCPKGMESTKIGKGASFKCACCGSIAEKKYIHDCFINKSVRNSLMSVVADANNRRVYVSPSDEQISSANNVFPSWIPQNDMNTNTPDLVSGRGYGITKWSELFTFRQLSVLSVYSDLINEVQQKIEIDAIKAGYSNDHIGLNDGGCGAKAYGQAVSLYLTFGLSRMTNIFNAFCRWESSREQALTLFSRQAIPMIWDFAENNPFAKAAGDFTVSLGSVVRVVENFNSCKQGTAKQKDAQSDCGLRNIMISTDPPYYDNIAYADLSDFFYLWLRKNLQDIYPDLMNTMMVPKTEELTAMSHRFGGDAKVAQKFFEDGMLSACKQIYKYARNDIPVTIYYAYKQSDTIGEKTASTGWETMLSAIIQAGFFITGTWPIRTEMANRMIASGTNALASSIVLVCRKRPEDAPQITKKNLVNIMRRELKPALKKLQDSNIAPVDMAQSAIGPGMGVYSRYSKVLEADGSEMTVRSALQLINEEIDLYFNEQIGNLDTASRFCVDLYTQYAYNDVKYGEAEILANAKATSIPMMASHGMLYAKAGIVHLVERENLPEKVDEGESNIWILTQQLTRAMEKGGVQECAKMLLSVIGSNAEYAKDLAYRLYTIAEKKNWAQEAYAYNALVVAWPDIQSAAAAMRSLQPEQMTFDI